MAPPFHTASFEQELDFSDLLYYFRPASVRAAHESLGTKSPLSLQAHAGTPTSLVMGRLLKSPEVHGLDIRLASPQEVEGKVNFTACTVPILIASMWPNTLCEFFARVPPAYNQYLQKGVLSRDLSIVLWSPLKLPLTQFNRGIMRAFSHFEPTDFADFSARKPPDAPSTSTYEGRHVRCFRRLLVWKTNRDFKAMLPRTGKEADALHSSVSTDPHKSSVISPSPRPGNALLPAYAEACPALLGGATPGLIRFKMWTASLSTIHPRIGGSTGGSPTARPHRAALCRRNEAATALRRAARELRSCPRRQLPRRHFGLHLFPTFASSQTDRPSPCRADGGDRRSARGVPPLQLRFAPLCA